MPTELAQLTQNDQLWTAPNPTKNHSKSARAIKLVIAEATGGKLPNMLWMNVTSVILQAAFLQTQQIAPGLRAIHLPDLTVTT